MKNTKFKKSEERYQIKLVESDTQGRIFYYSENGGQASWKDSQGVHTGASKKVLKDFSKNLYAPIYDEVVDYFKRHNISWWHMVGDSPQVPTGHIMSSQIQCLNHLFGIRNNENAIKALLLNSTGIAFDNILKSLDDDGLITFEFTYNNKELLGEDDAGARRGAFCTSIDAMIRAKKNDDVYLIPIEWKYTEAYEDTDLTCDKRMKRYQHLIEISSQLKTPEGGIPNSVYMREPQYELMRQTLLTEQLIRNNIGSRFFHINVIPDRNEDLLQSVKYDYMPMLVNPNIFRYIDPSDFLHPLTESPFAEDPQLHDMIEYLRIRYWDR